MLPSAGLSSRLANPALTAGTIDMFLAARQPWTEYLSQLTKQDSEPFPTTLNPAPMYRGRKVGREGELLKESVQLHYRRYPDEHVLTNLTRWRSGDMVGDVAVQQFRGAQPFVIEMPDETGMSNPTPDVFLKLNYKNPATLSKFLTRTGHFYPKHILALHPYAMYLLRDGLWKARHLGLFPKHGNPFWHRSQADRPKPYQAEYDPSKAHVKKTVEQFAYNWLQTYRIKQHFQKREIGSSKRDVSKTGESYGAAEREQQTAGYEGRASVPDASLEGPQGLGFSAKTSTVPGLISISGLRRNNLLYSKASKKRMGFPNPLGTTKKL